MDPEVLRLSQGVQLSYNLPHRNFDTCLYPIDAPNGSTIVVYGHNEGIRILWYAGLHPERLRNAKSDLHHDNSNFDREGQEPVNDSSANEEEDFESAEPYNQVIAYKDIPLGSSALLVSHLPLRSDIIATDGEELSLLRTHIVLAVACADLSLKAILCPLQISTSSTSQDVQVLSINDTNSHQELVTAIALTLAPAADELDQGHDNKIGSRSQSKSRKENSLGGSETNVQLSFLLASVSSTGKGLLMVHRFHTGNDGNGQNFKGFALVQRQFINGSLDRCAMSFNPSMYPSERYSKLLISYPSAGYAKIYDVTPSSLPNKRRRGSTTTIESSGNSAHTPGPQTLSAAWCCITLYAGFANQDPTFSLPRRKEILDARWICQGRSVLVILKDGEWGVWDVEAAGPLPSTSSQRLLKEQNNTSGLKGGSLTKFAIRGRIGGQDGPPNSTSSDDVNTTQRSSLTPMTPHTRKTKSDGLFKGSTKDTSMHSVDRMRVKGRITVSSGQNDGSIFEEAVILTYCNTNIFIPSIQALWRSEAGDGRSRSFPSGKHQGNLPPVRLGGETIQKVFLLSDYEPRSSSGLFAGQDSSPNYLVATTSRIIVQTTQHTENNHLRRSNASLPLRSFTKRPAEVDQALLRQGELDVDGMDRILDTMERGQTQKSASTMPGKKSVGFLPQDADGDVEMATPLMSKSSKSFSINRGGTAGRRNLFT